MKGLVDHSIEAPRWRINAQRFRRKRGALPVRLRIAALRFDQRTSRPATLPPVDELLERQIKLAAYDDPGGSAEWRRSRKKR